MTNFHRPILVVEIFIVVLPITFLLLLGLNGFYSSFLSRPQPYVGMFLLISILGLFSTVAVWYVTIAAIIRLKSSFKISKYWWWLVVLGLMMCLLSGGALIVLDPQILLFGLPVKDYLKVVLWGSPLVVPAVHSMLVFKYVGNANKRIQPTGLVGGWFLLRGFVICRHAFMLLCCLSAVG